jgi:hypothetical protein
VEELYRHQLSRSGARFWLNGPEPFFRKDLALSRPMGGVDLSPAAEVAQLVNNSGELRSHFSSLISSTPPVEGEAR